MVKILILSRDRLLTKVLDFNLTACGYDVHCASSLLKARCSSRKNSFDFLLCDFKFLKLLTSDLRTQYTIVLSSWNNEAFILENMPSIADDYVLEPFDMQEIKKLVKRQLERGGGANLASKSSIHTDAINLNL